MALQRAPVPSGTSEVHVPLIPHKSDFFDLFALLLPAPVTTSCRTSASDRRCSS